MKDYTLVEQVVFMRWLRISSCCHVWTSGSITRVKKHNEICERNSGKENCISVLHPKGWLHILKSSL